MHPVNKLLSHVGLRVIRSDSKNVLRREFRRKYKAVLRQLKRDPQGFFLYREERDEAGDHPANSTTHQCNYVAFHLSKLKPDRILDIGSYRLFILGLLSALPVTTVDIRPREPACDNEIVVTCDAKHLPFPDSSFDVVTSMCALEHFGLMMYGDEFDFDADGKTVREITRVLQPGGTFIFTTTITRGRPAIAFNSHRVYTYEMLHALMGDLQCVEERFYSTKKNEFCSFKEITMKPKTWDMYFGCWKLSP